MCWGQIKTRLLLDLHICYFPSLILVLAFYPSKMLMLTGNRSSSTNVTVILNDFTLETFGVPGSKTNSPLLCPSAQHILLTDVLTTSCILSDFWAFCLYFNRTMPGLDRRQWGTESRKSLDLNLTACMHWLTISCILKTFHPHSKHTGCQDWKSQIINLWRNIYCSIQLYVHCHSIVWDQYVFNVSLLLI